MRTIDRLTFISLLLSFEGWNCWEKIFIFHSSLRLMTYRMILDDQPCKHLVSSSLSITLLIPVDFFVVDNCTYTCLPHYFWLSYRYLLRFGRILQRLELDAFLAMSVSPLLHDVQTMQDLKVCTLLSRLDFCFYWEGHRTKFVYYMKMIWKKNLCLLCSCPMYYPAESIWPPC